MRRMSLRVYNSLTRQKEPFQTVNPGKVGMYLCGPTVYKSPHIGHMVGPVIFDAVKRYLQHSGYEVTWVVNITDVDDKLIEKAGELKTTMKELAEKHTAEYLGVLKSLGIDTIDHFPKATEHIPEIIAISQRLIDTGHAYAADGNVWFDVTRDEDYGKLTNRRVEDQESGARQTEGSGKKHPADFALWKAAKPGEPAWDSPWGKGRPGWHIECSAMSMKLLGETLDIHGGGLDLQFPHHENELAQSESCTGKPFARYWMHNGLTRIKTKASSGEWKDEKMSGSIGNVVSARELVDKFGPELVRYFLLSTHYRRPIEFTDEVLANCQKAYGVFTRLLERIERLAGSDGTKREAPPAGPLADEVKAYRQKFIDMMDDDFNTAGAIGVMHELAGAINGHIERSGAEKTRGADDIAAIAAAGVAFRQLGELLGLFRFAASPAATGESAELVDGLMKIIIEARQEARKAKQFAIADAIRKGLTALSITLEDRPDGTAWRKG
jgi:cysteinyl-tRNA synthetase